MKSAWSLMIALVLAASPAHADEAAFLGSLQGSWAGSGSVKIRINSTPVNVTCTFNSQTSKTELSLNGTCRGFVLISRSLGADLKFNGARYSGIYVGPNGGKAGLSGNRQGNVINLTIRWPKEVNGDRTARLMLQKTGADGMMLTTTDNDPSSGRNVVTSQINLRRS
ncbi:hypothetical protein EV286_10982 [Rhizobium sp. BK251]|nr:hypothetical protein [Rhizobium sp. BK251]TCL68155.1 hypothetical protein EV286_10982 [Rhizobium sp. BK251]